MLIIFYRGVFTVQINELIIINYNKNSFVLIYK